MNNERRIEELVSTMKSFEKETYHKSEILPELLELQREVVALTFEEGTEGIENLRIWDAKRKLEEKNQSRNGIAKEEFDRFAKMSGKVSNAISAEISGNRGEYYVFNKLERLRCENTVIKNLELSDGESKTELDAVVVTRKGIFIIEVKNSRKDIFISEEGGFYRTGEYNTYDCNIGEKMRFREALVKKILWKEGKERINIHSIVVFTNNRISVHNENRELKTCFLEQLLYNICNMDRDFFYEESEIEEIKELLEAARCKESYPFDFDIKEFKRDFASLIVKLENTQEEERKEETIEETKERMVTRSKMRQRREGERAKRKKMVARRNIEAVASVAIGILIAGSGLFQLGEALKKSA